MVFSIGAQILLKFLMNFLEKFANPQKLLTSNTLLGEDHSCISLTLFGSIFNSFEDITNPIYMSSIFMKENFFKFINNFSCCNLLNNIFKCLRFSSSVIMKSRISSKYTIMNLPIKYLSTSFNKLINVLGALVKKNVINNHSYNASFIFNVVFHSSPYLILI